MLRQCLEHGYFRGNKCLSCEQKGRFLMNDNELNGLGRVLAGVLRHFPEKFKLEMDDKGWIVISTLINAIRTRCTQYHWFRPHHLIAIVETDPKGRYQIQDNLVRATYGHSLDINLDLPTDDIPDKLYYPTTHEEVDLLMETGLRPSDRKRVHLSLSSEDAENAGKVRVPNPLILEIDAKSSIEAGNVIMHAGTTVFTTQEISPQFIQLMNGGDLGEIGPGSENTMFKIDPGPEPEPKPNPEPEEAQASDVQQESEDTTINDSSSATKEKDQVSQEINEKSSKNTDKKPTKTEKKSKKKKSTSKSKTKKK